MMFPSPCGVVVMNLQALCPSTGDANTVSVPLRGSGDESVIAAIFFGGRYVFPSPCGVVVMNLTPYQTLEHFMEDQASFRPLAG